MEIKKLDVQFLHFFKEYERLGETAFNPHQLKRVERCWNIYYHGFMDERDDIAYVHGKVVIEPGIYEVEVYGIPAILYLWKYTDDHTRDLKGLIVRKGDEEMMMDAQNKYDSSQTFI